MKNLLGIILGFGCIGTIWAQIGRRPPNYSQTNMPLTSFSCRDKILGGYYADPETDCQMFHVCVKVPGQGVQDYKFLCPNNTSFDQENQICDDWFNIDCEASTLYYSDNFDLYRIGSEFEGNRVSPGVQFPSNIVNNAVSDINDDYLRRSDRGDPIGSDLLRGSHSSNFFSNKNHGREDEEEVKKVPPTGKTGVRKLLAGKRPFIGTTSTLPPVSTSTQPVQIDTTQRQNFAGRSRGSSNFRGGFRNYNNNNKNTLAPVNTQNLPATNSANQNLPNVNNNVQNFPAVNNNNNQNVQTTNAYNNQNFPTTNAYNNQNFPAVNNNNRNVPAVNNNNVPVANNNFPAVNSNNQNAPQLRQFPNANFNVNQQVEPQRVNTAPTTQRPNYYTTTAPTAGRQNFFPTTVAVRQNYYSTESSTQPPTYATTPGYVPKQTSFYTTPSPVTSQRQGFFGVTATQETTEGRIIGFGNQNHNAYYSPSTQVPYQTYQTTTPAQTNYQTYPTTHTPSGFSTAARSSAGQPNQQSQQINNYFETAKLYKLNIDAQNGPNADHYEDSGEFLKTAPSQNLGAANFNRIQNVYKGFNTSVGASYNTEIVNATTLRPGFYNVRKNVNGVPTGFGQQFAQSTTPKFVQNSYNGTTAARNSVYSTQSPNQYQYYTTTTQKSAELNKIRQFPTGNDYTAAVTTIRPTNYYSPSGSAQTNYNNQASTRNFNEQTKYSGKNEKIPSFPSTINYGPSAQSSSAPFQGTALASVAIPADKTEKPRPFTVVSTQPPSPSPSKESKTEKDQYDYAYYDDAAHPEYDNLDAIEFSKTKSQK